MNHKTVIPSVIHPRKEVFSHKEAIAFLKPFKIQSYREYKKKYKNLSPKLHSNPYVRYGKEWIGWPEYLSLKEHSRQKRHIFTYEEARDFVRKHHIKTRQEYIERYRNLCPKLPSDPNMVYKKEWTSWLCFLVEKIPKFSYKEAVAFLKDKKIKTKNEYVEKHKSLSPRLVRNASQVYRKEWKNWYVYLNKTRR